MNRLTEEEVLSRNNGRQMLDLARALCDACSGFCAGQANRTTFGLAGQVNALDVKGTAAMYGPIRPAWWHFLREASVIIDHFGADVPIDRAVRLVAELRNR